MVPAKKKTWKVWLSTVKQCAHLEDCDCPKIHEVLVAVTGRQPRRKISSSEDLNIVASSFEFETKELAEECIAKLRASKELYAFFNVIDGPAVE